MAKAAHLAAIAITDHDILDGYQEAIGPAQELGIELIPGLEMSASWDGLEVHVLGLFVDPANAPLQEGLAQQRTRRLQRLQEMVARVQQLGLSITLDEVLAIAGQGAVGRPHLAQALVRRGYVATFEEAFRRYLGPDCPAFVPGSPLNPKVVIQAIRQAGGIPILAHPVYLRDDTLIERFSREGLAGLEVYHASHTPELIQRYERIADELGLLKTGGTDYHGTVKEGAQIGAVTIPYHLVEALKQWRHANTKPSCAPPSD